MTLIKDLDYNSKILPVQITWKYHFPASFSMINMYFLQFKVRLFHYELLPIMNYNVIIPTLFLVPIYFLDDLKKMIFSPLLSFPFSMRKQYIWGNFP